MVANPEAEALVAQFLVANGLSHRRLAMLCALPKILTPEIVGALRLDFAREAPWYAEADLLLSDLCVELGYEQYAYRVEVRESLLRMADELLGEDLIEQASRALLGHIDRLAHLGGRFTAEQIEGQQWAALQFFPEGVAELHEKLLAHLVGLFRNSPQGGERKAAVDRLAAMAGDLKTSDESLASTIDYTLRLSRLTVETLRGLSLEGDTVLYGGKTLPALPEEESTYGVTFEFQPLEPTPETPAEIYALAERLHRAALPPEPDRFAVVFGGIGDRQEMIRWTLEAAGYQVVDEYRSRKEPLPHFAHWVGVILDWKADGAAEPFDFLRRISVESTLTIFAVAGPQSLQISLYRQGPTLIVQEVRGTSGLHSRDVEGLFAAILAALASDAAPLRNGSLTALDLQYLLPSAEYGFTLDYVTRNSTKEPPPNWDLISAERLALIRDVLRREDTPEPERPAQLVELEDCRITGIAWSQDGGALAIAGGSRLAMVDSEGRRLPVPFTPPSTVESVAFGPFSIACGLGNGQLVFLNAFNWTATTEATRFTGKVDDMAMANRLFACCARQGGVQSSRPWVEESDGQFRGDFKRSVISTEPGAICVAANWAILGVAAGYQSGEVLISIEERSDVQSIRGYTHASAVNALAWASNPSLLASASSDQTVQVCLVEKKRTSAQVSYHSLQEVATLQHEGEVVGVSFSRNQQILATLERGGKVRLWRCDIWQELESFDCEPGDYYGGVAFSPADDILAAFGGSASKLFLYRVDAGRYFADDPFTPGENAWPRRKPRRQAFFVESDSTRGPSEEARLLATIGYRVSTVVDSYPFDKLRRRLVNACPDSIDEDVTLVFIRDEDLPGAIGGSGLQPYSVPPPRWANGKAPSGLVLFVDYLNPRRPVAQPSHFDTWSKWIFYEPMEDGEATLRSRLRAKLEEPERLALTLLAFLPESEEARRDLPVIASSRDRGFLHGLRDVTEPLSGKLLWVTNHPRKYAYDTGYLEAMGLTVEHAETTTEAVALLEKPGYCAVISDTTRPESKRAWSDLIDQARRPLPPLIVSSRANWRKLGAPENDPGVYGVARDLEGLVDLVRTVVTVGDPFTYRLFSMEADGYWRAVGYCVRVYANEYSSESYVVTATMPLVVPGASHEVVERPSPLYLGKATPQWATSEVVGGPNLEVLRVETQLTACQLKVAELPFDGRISWPAQDGKRSHFVRFSDLMATNRPENSAGLPVIEDLTGRVVGIYTGVSVEPVESLLDDWPEAPQEFWDVLAPGEMVGFLDSSLLPVEPKGRLRGNSGITAVNVRHSGKWSYALMVFDEYRSSVPRKRLLVNGRRPDRFWPADEDPLRLEGLMGMRIQNNDGWPEVAIGQVPEPRGRCVVRIVEIGREDRSQHGLVLGVGNPVSPLRIAFDENLDSGFAGAPVFDERGALFAFLTPVAPGATICEAIPLTDLDSLCPGFLQAIEDAQPKQAAATTFIAIPQTERLIAGASYLIEAMHNLGFPGFVELDAATGVQAARNAADLGPVVLCVFPDHTEKTAFLSAMAPTVFDLIDQSGFDRAQHAVLLFSDFDETTRLSDDPIQALANARGLTIRLLTAFRGSAVDRLDGVLTAESLQRWPASGFAARNLSGRNSPLARFDIPEQISYRGLGEILAVGLGPWPLLEAAGASVTWHASMREVQSMPSQDIVIVNPQAMGLSDSLWELRTGRFPILYNPLQLEWPLPRGWFVAEDLVGLLGLLGSIRYSKSPEVKSVRDLVDRLVLLQADARNTVADLHAKLWPQGYEQYAFRGRAFQRGMQRLLFKLNDADGVTQEIARQLASIVSPADSLNTRSFDDFVSAWEGVSQSRIVFAFPLSQGFGSEEGSQTRRELDLLLMQILRAQGSTSARVLHFTESPARMERNRYPTKPLEMALLEPLATVSADYENLQHAICALVEAMVEGWRGPGRTVS